MRGNSSTPMAGSRAPMARLGRRLIPALILAALALAALARVAAAAPPTPETDPFYKYSGPKPLAQIAPGTVLKTRTFSYHPINVTPAAKAIQLLYRSTSELGEPTVNVTTVLEPALALSPPSVIAYGSFYDSLKAADEPSYSLQGGPTAGGRLDQLESAIIGLLLLTGRTVVVADTEGQNADFAAGPEYGRNTLDSLRAALASPATGMAGAKGSACSVIRAARSRPSGRPSSPPATRLRSTASWSARRWAASSSTRPTTCTTSTAASAGPG